MAVGNILGQTPGVQAVNGVEPDAVGNVNIDPKTWEALKQWNLEINWPVGSLWWSAKATNPREIVGGNWVQRKDVFILAAGNKYPVNSTGGEAKHELTVEELPTHASSIKYDYEGIEHASKADVFTVGLAYQSKWKDVTGPINQIGQSIPHNNMPPYLAKYCWERIS